jgi:hypothetical protein
MVSMGVVVVMGGETIGVSVPVEVVGGSVSMEVVVGLVPGPVLVVDLQVVVKNNSNVTRRIDNDFCCFISSSIR